MYWLPRNAGITGGTSLHHVTPQGREQQERMEQTKLTGRDFIPFLGDRDSLKRSHFLP